ncbi:site-specific DNA-methyltransferase [soil metagenome]
MKKPGKPVLGQNKLYYGDNLNVLRKYISTDSVDLCYIDPPFNSKRKYNQIYKNIGKEDQAQAQAFIDTWTWDEAAEKGLQEIQENESSIFPSQTMDLVRGLVSVLGKGALLSYLVNMALRIAEIYRVLKPTGSFYLHCDPTASHYLKIIVDSIFCSRTGEFQSEIVWRRTGSHNKLERFGPIHDIIFFYTKSSEYTWNHPKRAFMTGHINENFVKDSKGYRTDYYGNVLTGSGIRGGESGETWRGFNPTSKGRHWAIPGAVLQDIEEDLSALSQHQKLDRLHELGFIKIVEGQAWPIYERYLNAKDGQALSDIWAFQPYTNGTVFGSNLGIDEEVRWLSTKDSERLGYPTQKPEGLLERIIAASTEKGDIVLDAFCGCGTTVAVAEKLNRKWIGIDITYQSISVILKRFQDSYSPEVLANIELNGVPKDIESAIALANKKEDKVRKEFEKWAVLSFSDNKAAINEKKGGDGGVDGVGYMVDLDSKNQPTNVKVILSVKSDKKLDPKILRELYGAMQINGSPKGYLITLYKHENLVKAAKQYGLYKNRLIDKDFPALEVICVKDILDGKRMDLPNPREVLKKASRKSSEQSALDLE